MKVEVERLQERLGGKNGEKAWERFWLYRESFPKFNEEEINFSIFTKGTARLLLEENLKEYVVLFVRRIKELTGWKDLILTETNEKRENDV